MITWLQGILLLDSATYTQTKASGQAFRRGLLVMLVVGLIVALVQVTAGAVTTTFGGGPTAEIRSLIDQIQGPAGQYIPATSRQMTVRILQSIVQIVEQIERLPTPLPKPIGSFLYSLGLIASRPFGMLGSLLGYTLLVQLAAMFLGGKGRVQDTLGLGALSYVPHILDLFNGLPCLGFIISFIAAVWGLVIYVKATAVAHEMSPGKAFFAVILPLLVFLLIVIALIAGLLLFVGWAGAQ